MPSSVPTFRPPWLPRDKIRQQQRRDHDERRGSARERGYDTRWEKARLSYLMRDPLCVCCKANGHACPATVVDHIVPHKGDRALFWNSDNWQGLCEWCDKAIKRTIENKWLSTGGNTDELKLGRRIDGWLHPADR